MQCYDFLFFLFIVFGTLWRKLSKILYYIPIVFIAKSDMKRRKRICGSFCRYFIVILPFIYQEKQLNKNYCSMSVLYETRKQ